MSKFIHRINGNLVVPKEDSPTGRLKKMLFRRAATCWKDGIEEAETPSHEEESVEDHFRNWLCEDVPSAEWAVGMLAHGSSGFVVFEELVNDARDKNEYGGDVVKNCSVDAERVRGMLQRLTDDIIGSRAPRASRAYRPRAYKPMKTITRPGYGGELH